MTREEAIKVASETYGWLKTDREREALETLIPELVESDDERIRKELITHLKQEERSATLEVNKKRWREMITYLERQKDQKPAEWNDTDMKEARVSLISVCRDWERGEQTTLLPIAAVRARYFLEHLTEPKPAEWSEEDKEMFRIVSNRIEKFDEWATEQGYPIDDPTMKQSPIAWLKSFRPQPHTVSIKDATKFGNLEYERGVKDGIQSEKSRQWKPTDEQMNALDFVLRFDETDGHKEALQSLWAQLNKLT